MKGGGHEKRREKREREYNRNKNNCETRTNNQENVKMFFLVKEHPYVFLQIQCQKSCLELSRRMSTETRYIKRLLGLNYSRLEFQCYQFCSW